MATIIESSHVSCEQWVDKVYECCRAVAGQSEATKKVVQKLEEDKTAVFKKKGNEIQF